MINIYLFLSTTWRIIKFKNETSYDFDEISQHYSITDVWLKLYIILFIIIISHIYIETTYSTNCQDTCLNYHDDNYHFDNEYLFNISKTNNYHMKMKLLACQKLF